MPSTYLPRTPFLAALTVLLIALPAPGGDGKAEARLTELQKRVAKQDFDGDKLRRDLLVLCLEQVGTPLYAKCLDALRHVPSPLDRLDEKAIDEEERKFLSLPGLVGYARPHGRAISHIAVSFDGTFLATSGWDNAVHLYRLGGKRPKSWAKLDGSPSGIAFSPDSKLLATGNSDTRVIVWDLTGEKPKEEHKLSGHKNRPFSLAFAPTGKMLVSGSHDPILRIWKLDDLTPELWKVLANEKSPLLGISSLAFTHDGKHLIAGGHIGTETLRAWSLADALEEKNVPPVLARLVTASPTEPILAFADDTGTVHLWKFDGKVEKLRKLAGHPGKSLLTPVKALTFSPDGKLLASSGQDKRLRLWDVSTGDKLREWNFLDEARALSFSSDGRHLAVGNSDGTVYLLRLEPTRFKLE